MRRLKPSLVLSAILALISHPACAQSGFSLSPAFEYTRGGFGAAVDTEIWYYAVTGKYESGPLILRLTLPHIKITGPGNVIGGAGERIQLGAAAATTRRSASGMGDVVASASYNVYQNRAAGELIDLTAKIKFGTADEDKGLGTGKNDYSIQADFTKSFGQFSTFGTLGWKKLGDPTIAGVPVDFRNPWYAVLGGAYKFTRATTGGIDYYYRQRVIGGGSRVSELRPFVSHSLTKTTRLQGYALTGFTDGSPDWGVGVVLSADF